MRFVYNLRSKFNLLLSLKFLFRGLSLAEFDSSFLTGTGNICMSEISLIYVHKINWTRFERICFISGLLQICTDELFGLTLQRYSDSQISDLIIS